MKIYSHLNSEYKTPGALKVLHDLRQENKTLKRVVKGYKDGGSQSICNVSKKNKKRLRIVVRRNYKGFDGLSDFVKAAIENYTGKSMEELYKMGDMESSFDKLEKIKHGQKR